MRGEARSVEEEKNIRGKRTSENEMAGKEAATREASGRNDSVKTLLPKTVGGALWAGLDCPWPKLFSLFFTGGAPDKAEKVPKRRQEQKRK